MNFCAGSVYFFYTSPMKFSIDSTRCPWHKNTLSIQLFSPAALKAFSVENNLTFGKPLSSSMSHLSHRSIKIKKRPNQLSVISQLVSCMVCLMHPDSSFQRYNISHFENCSQCQDVISFLLSRFVVKS